MAYRNFKVLSLTCVDNRAAVKLDSDSSSDTESDMEPESSPQTPATSTSHVDTRPPTSSLDFSLPDRPKPLSLSFSLRNSPEPPLPDLQASICNLQPNDDPLSDAEPCSIVADGLTPTVSSPVTTCTAPTSIDVMTPRSVQAERRR